MAHVASSVLILDEHVQLREKRESQVAIARARETAERMRRVAADIRRMNALYRERLVGTREDAR